MLKKLLTITTLFITSLLYATPGETRGGADTTSLYDVSYQYDKLNRVTKATYASGESITYEYDAGGNLLKVVFSDPNEIKDSDGDGHYDDRDAFPSDPNEWLDTDGDGVGNNADLDDDNDGISDLDEEKYGLDPLDANDAYIDSDGDGYSNIVEIEANTDLNDKASKPKKLDSVAVKKIGEYIDSKYISLEVDNNYAYVLADSGLKIFDIRDSSHIKLISQLALSNYKYKIKKEANYLYVANGDDGLQIIDISNINSPKIAGNYTSGWAEDVAIEGNYAYVVCNGGGALNIVDISNKSAPKLIAKYADAGMTLLTVDRGYVYADNFGGKKGISILKLNSQNKIELIGKYEENETTSKATVKDIVVRGNYAYVIVENQGIRVLDISDKSNSTLLTTIDAKDNVSLELYAQYLFTTSASNEGTKIIDISDINNPKILGKFHTYKLSREMKIYENNLYIVGESEGLKVFTTIPKLFGIDNNKITKPHIDTFKVIKNSNIDTLYNIKAHISKGSNELSYYNIYFYSSNHSRNCNSKSMFGTVSTEPNGGPNEHKPPIISPTIDIDTNVELDSCIDRVKLEVCDEDEECSVSVKILKRDSGLKDTDQDGIPDTIEIKLGLNPNSQDSDNDGILDSDEIGDFYNPTDTDNDGIIDALDTDSDNDGISDSDEIQAGTNPYDKNNHPIIKDIDLDDIDNVELPINSKPYWIKLHIKNTTGDKVYVKAKSYNKELLIIGNNNPLELIPIHNAKGHTKVQVTAKAGNKYSSKIFEVYIGEKEKKFAPIMHDDIFVILPVK